REVLDEADRRECGASNCVRANRERAVLHNEGRREAASRILRRLKDESCCLCFLVCFESCKIGRKEDEVEELGYALARLRRDPCEGHRAAEPFKVDAALQRAYLRLFDVSARF